MHSRKKFGAFAFFLKGFGARNAQNLVTFVLRKNPDYQRKVQLAIVFDTSNTLNEIFSRSIKVL